MTLLPECSVRMVERPQCPTCGTPEGTVVWSGRFIDPPVQKFMEMFRYSGDWVSALADAHFELSRCSTCGMSWHRHVIAPEWVDIVYGRWADAAQAVRFDREQGRGKANDFASATQRAKLILRLRHLLGESRERRPQLLDFGCGDGALLHTARAFAIEAHGVDVSASRTRAAREAGIPIWPSLEAFADAANGPADIVVLSQVLEHVADPLSLLRALHDHTSPEGVLFVAVPDATGITVPRSFEEFHAVQPLEHINAFSPNSLVRICERAGYTRLQRPCAFVTSSPREALRAAANLLWQPSKTDQYFRKITRT